ncbi:hypothetical protein [Amycolatopsis mediterranei]|uniref:Uncharacterized protein n=1 Tax=Amycolatopsis mediterranei (strain S699) TaxID=713604 RepID=A0A9R0P0Z0_AMYMS|nr:hypothetical protein [Amycolatopsis mediterranei]AEK44307.1 hypothetical protein RAM_29150 [Amycolatopsis mediterranei S699]UZF72459.1 hypothetical protein ISP_005820 [Amycolatopsis mediterranei]
MLLAPDTSVGEVDTKEVIPARVEVSGETLRLVAKRFAETGGDIWATIERKRREHPPVPSPVTGEVEARFDAQRAAIGVPSARTTLRVQPPRPRRSRTQRIPGLRHWSSAAEPSSWSCAGRCY